MGEFVSQLKRTHNCGELRKEHIGQTVVLMGWVQNHRDHGKTVMVDLRDRGGLTQLVFDYAISPEALKTAESMRSEFVIAVQGEVASRGEAINPKLATGEIEIKVRKAEILNRSEPVPFAIEDETGVNETSRLKHRVLDLRRFPMQRNIMMRHRISKVMRDYCDGLGFLELETPMLTKSTPEGARDFLVPSRIHPGEFYALPQSPQLFKQLFMVAGYDRYFQIVRCFRDEDLRADRQPEFTQFDMEMSFASQEDIFQVVEGLIRNIWKVVEGVDLPARFPRMTWRQAMDDYGIDKPDTRFGLPLREVSEIVADSDFKVFREVVKGGGIVKGLNVKGGVSMSRSELDELSAFAQQLGAKGMAWVKVNPDGWQSPIAKFLSDGEKQKLAEKLALETGDLAIFIADRHHLANQVLAQIRLQLGRQLKLIDESRWNFLWVVDFPLFEWDDANMRISPAHHPFTSPVIEDAGFLETNPLQVRAQSYDLVLNGNELGSGSVRIHNSELQSKIFDLLGIGEEQQRVKFGFLLDAFRFGAPPHAGIALGLDRITMLLARATSLRDVIAFPKTARGQCLLTSAPSLVDDDQLKELGLRIAHTAKPQAV
ncbi:MAG: Aspartate--tRNA ligase [Myxococcota bacterium]|nr:Aspartate--tRNA ligase [Myxococcota bacterium]